MKKLNDLLIKAIEAQLADINKLTSTSDRIFYRGHILICFHPPKYTQIKKEEKKVCSICGFDDEGTHEVHHIDKNTKNNAESNLVTLCANCHRKLHRNLITIIPTALRKRE